MLVRPADPDRDAAACAAIYAPYVADSAVSFEEVPPSAAQFAALIAQTSARYPWIVLEDAGTVVGYAYATQHRTRAAYRWAVEVGIYIDPARQRSGAGRRLYETLFELLRRQGLRTALAAVTLPNEASVGLHRAFGFEHVGTHREIGWKAGAWRDVSWWQLQLLGERDGNDDDDAAPPEPRGPQSP